VIWDAVMLGGRRELDLLELRLRTLDPYVDRFAVVESSRTFAGDPKPLAYLEAGDRFAEWAGRIDYHPADLRPGPPWQLERAQRDQLAVPLAAAGPGDTVIMSDLDEIPDLAGWEPAPYPQTFVIRQHVFAVDWIHPVPLAAPVAIPWRVHLAAPAQMSDVRDHKEKWPVVFGGWHFSWLGGPAAIAEKAAAHAHLELNQRILAENARGRLYERGWVPWDRRQQVAVEVDQTWPEWIFKRECPPSWFAS
jgi:beta-1,4-mannosyl-glycoprotein beta-1,4-N-acetylglucosaminyltransferase